MYIHIYVYTYIHIYIYIYTYTCTYAHIGAIRRTLGHGAETTGRVQVEKRFPKGDDFPTSQGKQGDPNTKQTTQQGMGYYGEA